MRSAARRPPTADGGRYNQGADETKEEGRGFIDGAGNERATRHEAHRRATEQEKQQALAKRLGVSCGWKVKEE